MTNLIHTLGETTIVGNELWRIGAFFLVILAALVVGKVLHKVLERAAKRLSTGDRAYTASLCGSVSKSAVLLTFAFGLQYAMRVLAMSDSVRKGSDTITGVLMTLAIGWLVYHAVEIVDVWLHRLAGQTASKMDDMLAPLVRKSLRVTIVVLTLVQVAQIVSDQPITSILAGLSVGGLAIGLAAKDTVSNFFGSLVILADKPFELGDRVVIDGHDGPVEEVGFRSTKLRTLDGHLVSIPNGTLANMTIQNIGKRPNIKRAMNLGVTYDTPPEKIERALAIVKELLQDHEGIRPEMPPRVYFSDLKADSLNISAIYWYHPADYWAFMDFSEKLNLQILQRFAAEGIEFAFPTQTVHLAGGAAPGFAGKSEV